MATKPSGKMVRDGSVCREDLNKTIPGKAVITNVKAGLGVILESTGADEGTGEVTISVSPNSSIKQYRHDQHIADTTWTINHNLSGYPEAVILDDIGERIYGDTYYPNPDSLVIVFSIAVSGFAVLTLNKAVQSEFMFNEPSTVWNVVHNLDRYPDVLTFDTSDGNLRIYGDIQYPTANNLIVTFNNPVSGHLYIV